MGVSSQVASVAIMLLAFSLQVAYAGYNVTSYCQLVPTGTKFPSLISCQKYYICRDNGQVIETSCSGNDVFSKDKQKCVSASSANCNIKTPNPCDNNVVGFVSDPNDCQRWIYCEKNEILSSGNCAYGHYFNKDTKLCAAGDCPYSSVPTEIENICQIMQVGQFFGDIDDCAAWHVCYGNQDSKGVCQNGLIYNTETRMCVPSNGNMCAGPTEICNETELNKIIPNSGVCSIYFECTVSNNNNYTWKKNSCENGEYYDVNTKSCKNRQEATPVEGCDRCEFVNANFVNAVDPTCMNYLVCQDGKEIVKGTCVSGYFNEQEQICTNNDTNLPDYRKNNGACYLETATTTEEPSKESTPAKTDPEESTPAKTDPEESTPATTEPEKSTPATTDPEKSTLATTEPEETKPTETEPEKTTPATTEPEETKPTETEPEKTTPATTEPEPVETTLDGKNPALDNGKTKKPPKKTTTKKPKATKKPKN